MHKLKQIALVVLLFAFSTNAADITLKWDASPVEDKVLGYCFYQSTGTNAFQKIAFTTNTTITLTNYIPAQYRWKVTATNMWGESDFSEEIVTPKPASIPQNFKLWILITR